METLVQQQYDRLAQIYDQRWQFYITNTLSFLIEWAVIAPGEKVLDVACGTGEPVARCPLIWPLRPRKNCIGSDLN